MSKIDLSHIHLSVAVKQILSLVILFFPKLSDDERSLITILLNGGISPAQLHAAKAALTAVPPTN